MKLHFEIFGREFGFLFGTRKKLQEPIAGITNRTQDGYYILFLDYDEIPYDWLLGELEDIQNEYLLSDLFVFESTKDHFHVICFDKLTREEYQEILFRSSCDPQYKKIPFTWGRRVATLRVTEKQGNKIIHHSTITSDTMVSRREKSNAHRMFFEKIYGIEAPRGRYDTNEDVIMAKYKI